MSRFFVRPEDVGEEEILLRDPGDIKHLSKVLRLQPGDEIEISDSSCFEYRAEISEIAPALVRARILDKQAFRGEPKTRATLFQGVPKQGKMESIVQKCVELGVAEIVPVFTARTVVTEKGKNLEHKRERWQKVADEAVKQCGRGLIPQIRPFMRFSEMLEAVSGDAFDLLVFLYENEEERSIKDLLRALPAAEGRRVALFVGPEGGFSEAEAEALRALAPPVTLGKTVLRTETAGMAALAMLFYELEL
jgi:16S rRNA (uracil1498-N3)-methyltransferase